MFLVINPQNVIVVATQTPVSEEDCASRNEIIIEIPDNEFTTDMLGAIYNANPIN